jgi:hypothetical protein
VTPEQKLAGIFRSLREAGIDALVMGGHAVRYYGVGRNTVDFDLVTSVTSPDELRSRLAAIPTLAGARAEPVWRGRDFARFEIGTLPDGREEWLEFWLRNHLLGHFAGLKGRAEIGNYGGEAIPFLGLSDLMRSKETERESDWQDISLLEEIRDDRNRVAMASAPDGAVAFLAELRSRRGMDYALEHLLLADRAVVTKALAVTTHPVSYAFLYPFVGTQGIGALTRPHLAAILTSVTPATAKHLAAVEIIRRDYKRRAMELDRADKQDHLRDR